MSASTRSGGTGSGRPSAAKSRATSWTTFVRELVTPADGSGPRFAGRITRPTWFQIAARLEGKHQDEPVPHTIRYSVGDNRIDIELDDGGKSSLWWATRSEWLGHLDVAGLELEALYGGFAGEPFTDESREYVFVARR